MTTTIFWAGLSVVIFAAIAVTVISRFQLLEEFETIVHGRRDQPIEATLEVLNAQIFGFNVAEIKKILKREFDVKCILHSEEQYVESAKEDTKLKKNDQIIISAFDYDMDAIEALVGRLRLQGQHC